MTRYPRLLLSAGARIRYLSTAGTRRWQQTSCTPLLLSIGGTAGQTDGRIPTIT